MRISPNQERELLRCPNGNVSTETGQVQSTLERHGWQVARQRGSHVRLKHPDRTRPLTVPLHKEIRRKTLTGILKDAGMTTEELRKLL